MEAAAVPAHSGRETLPPQTCSVLPGFRRCRPTLSTQANPRLQSKISSLMSDADGVVVGNAYLRSYASQFTPRVSVIPTVLDISRYPLHPNSASRPNDEVRIGWIGTPSTSAFLQGLSHIFHTLQRRFRVTCIFDLSALRRECSPLMD